MCQPINIELVKVTMVDFLVVVDALESPASSSRLDSVTRHSDKGPKTNSKMVDSDHVAGATNPEIEI